ncbi:MULTISPECIES: glutamate 5-kinase [Rhodomicrobium]|uniref:glutamate 5-kinase n=1 Tax=Rhodomicrobium TaxID=1068 RepID=UPI000B4B2B8D|nr:MULTISPECIES: glutamate 5-kinase [Rhodomicrobium]
MREEWSGARRIVVKIGSALLVEKDSGKLKSDWLSALADDVAALKAQGRDLLIVSSGAIALGRRALGLPKGPLKLEESQAAAAVGQVTLARAYQEMFSARGITAAQILLTLSDTEERRRYLNARSTVSTLLALGAVPVVNENDTVATTEIRYGDNDRLAARVGSMMSADCVVLLSDIDGLYTAPPAQDATARRLDVVDEITPEIEAMAGDAGSELSRGGMITKIVAAKIAVAAGANLVITSGKILNPLKALGEGAACTWFLARANPMISRKRWIAGSLEPRGIVTIDAGAAAALDAGRSLLPAGVTRLDGSFDRGDAVIIRDAGGRELGRGLIAYSRRDAERLVGRKSGEIEGILGYRGRSEMIHRDDMALNRS